MARLKLAPPWAIYYNELKAMFENDPEIGIVYDSDNQKIIMYVDNAEKAEALETILETNLEFGEAAWTLEIVPSNSVEKAEPDVVITCKSDIYKQKIAFDVAFTDNPALSYIKIVNGLFSNPLCYVVFKHTVVQYFNDSLADINGLCSTLYQEIAKKIFKKMDGVFYCTDLPSGYTVNTSIAVDDTHWFT